MPEPSDDPTCVACGETIDREDGEVPVWIEYEEEFEYEGDAYHLNECEGEMFDEVYCEVGDA